jgi:two-component system, chemotaxis family, chemotaxis protein CheY
MRNAITRLSTAAINKRLEKIQILIIDNSIHTSNLIKAVLEKFGFSKILVARDAYEGAKELRNNSVHIVFADWELKVFRNKADIPSKTDSLLLNGMQFTKSVRHSANSRNPFVPIVLSIERGNPCSKDSLRDCGVNSILTKPFDAATIAERLINIIEEKRLFIKSAFYRGPCRRLYLLPPPASGERRKSILRLANLNTNHSGAL